MGNKRSVYKDADELTADVDSPSPSVRRPGRTGKSGASSPAANPENTKVERQASMLEQVTEKNRELSERLEEALAELDQARKSGDGEEAARLSDELKRLKEGGAKHGDTMSRVMPVTQTVVEFRLEEVDPALCDVSSLNGRDQELLDKGCVEDIFPSMQSTGQLVPGMGRKKPDGRYEVVEGSRRLFAVRLLGVGYQMWVGEIADADIALISEKGNEHEKTSPWELAQFYAGQIEAGTFKSWEHLAIEKGISERTKRRYKSMVGVDRLFVRPFLKPAGFSVRHCEWLLSKIKDEENKKALIDTARKLAKQKASALAAGEDWLEDDEVQSEYKRALKEKVVAPSGGMATRGVYDFRNASASVTMAARNMRNGKRKLELVGLSDKQFEKAMKMVAQEFDLERTE